MKSQPERSIYKLMGVGIASGKIMQAELAHIMKLHPIRKKDH
jgi:hypothetical protein